MDSGSDIELGARLSGSKAETRDSPKECCDSCSVLAHWRQRLRVTGVLLRERPSIAAAAVLVFVVLCGAGLAGVLVASANEVSKAQDLASNGVGAQVALSLREALLISTFGSELLCAVVGQTPQCPVLEATWGRIAADIMARVGRTVVQQLELDVAGVIWKTDPPLEGQLADILYGRDLLKEESDRPGTLLLLRERRTLILGPYTCTEGFQCAFTVTPVFLPAPTYEYDWGCGVQPYNCTELCWDPVNKVKFWGQVSTMLNLDSFLASSDARLSILLERGYLFRLWQEETSSSNPFVVLASSPRLPERPVTQSVAIYNLVWHLDLAPASGWVPVWRDPCIAAVVVGSALVSLLVLWLLVSKEQHNSLLCEMLPGKVIRQLQKGDHAIAQQFDCVTILFSDIVGYTTVASKLTPFQVVTLLNELFTVFDELTARNDVYKVETIGDSLMCVAGCPVAESGPRSAQRIADMGLDMVHAVAAFTPSLPGVRLRIRVGAHSGSVVAGVVGRRMPRYCLFGDTVNVASRMESSGEPMRLQVSATTADLLRQLPPAEQAQYVLEPRGPVAIKGKGVMDTWWLSRPAAPGGPLDLLDHPVSAIASRRAPSVTVMQLQRSGTSLLPASRGGTLAGGGGTPSSSQAFQHCGSADSFASAADGNGAGAGGGAGRAGGGTAAGAGGDGGGEGAGGQGGGQGSGRGEEQGGAASV